MTDDADDDAFAAAVDWVERFHAAVEEAVAPVELANRGRLRCGRGCSDCCGDGLRVFGIEAAVIERHHAALLETAAPHAPGACAFLDAEGACRIYAQRPYVCRTQGLPLRWLEEEASEIVEVRDICPKNVDDGPPLEELASGDCWSIGPFEARLAERQASVAGGGDREPGERVLLRSLFERSGASANDARRRLPLARG